MQEAIAAYELNRKKTVVLGIDAIDRYISSCLGKSLESKRAWKDYVNSIV